MGPKKRVRPWNVQISGPKRCRLPSNGSGPRRPTSIWLACYNTARTSHEHAHTGARKIHDFRNCNILYDLPQSITKKVCLCVVVVEVVVVVVAVVVVVVVVVLVLQLADR